MNKRRLPIFLELTIVSLIIIITILSIYSVVQLISLNSFSTEYQEEQLEDRYDEIVYLLSNAPDIDINKILKDSEYIRIYQDDKIIYATETILWNNIKLNNSILNKVKYKVKSSDADVVYLGFEKYVLMEGVFQEDNKDYSIQILQQEEIMEEFAEKYVPIYAGSIILGLILSIIGAIFVSKRFIKKLKVLTNTMIEVKEHGIKERVEISKAHDEFDRVSLVFNSMMDEVEEAFEEQSRFVSDASHELKTPLTALKGHLSMIKRWGKNDKERLEKSLDICISETDRLNKIVQDLLLLSKSEKEEIDLSLVEFIKVKPIINELINHYSILNNKISFSVEIEEDAELKIMPDHLKQLLIIFLDNAIKYNDKDIIEVKLKLKDDILSIRDNGIGIAEEEIPYIMKRFYKTDKSRVNKNNSFGLGLSIAERIIKNYHGSIFIKSKIGEFTQFNISFRG